MLKTTAFLSPPFYPLVSGCNPKERSVPNLLELFYIIALVDHPDEFLVIFGVGVSPLLSGSDGFPIFNPIQQHLIDVIRIAKRIDGRI